MFSHLRAPPSRQVPASLPPGGGPEVAWHEGVCSCCRAPREPRACFRVCAKATGREGCCLPSPRGLSSAHRRGPSSEHWTFSFAVFPGVVSFSGTRLCFYIYLQSSRGLFAMRQVLTTQPPVRLVRKRRVSSVITEEVRGLHPTSAGRPVPRSMGSVAVFPLPSARRPALFSHRGAPPELALAHLLACGLLPTCWPSPQCASRRLHVHGPAVLCSEVAHPHLASVLPGQPRPTPGPSVLGNLLNPWCTGDPCLTSHSIGGFFPITGLISLS